MIRIDLGQVQPLVVTEAKLRDDIRSTVSRLSKKKGWRKVGLTRESILGHVDRKFIHHAEHYAKMLNGGKREDGSSFKGTAGVGRVYMDVDESTCSVVINGSLEWNAAPHTYETSVRFNNYDKIANLPEHTWAEKARALMEDHVQVHCTCEAFQYYHARAATVKGFALIAENRPAKKNNPKNRGGVCKHLEHALRYLPANYAKIASGMKKAALSESVDHLKESKRYTHAELLKMGADGHLRSATLQMVPLHKLDGLEPVPANDTPDGKYRPGREITQPIEVVHDKENDKYIVYAGNHRIAQARANGYTHIKAFVESSAVHPMIDVDGEMKHRHNSEGRPIHATDDGIRNFHRWFGDSKVVDEHGRPQVLYHGGRAGITNFDPNLAGTVKTADWGSGVYLTPSKTSAEQYQSDFERYTDKHANALYDKIEDTAKSYGTSGMAASMDLARGKISPEQHAHLKQLDAEWRDAMRTAHQRNRGDTYATYVSMKRPYSFRAGSMPDPTAADRAKEKGADGLVIRHSDGSLDEVVAFHPSQIKSATTNNGNFSKDSPHIGESVADLIDDYLNEAKVTPPTGLTIYHGTSKDFTGPLSRAADREGNQALGPGMYFSTNPEDASGYSEGSEKEVPHARVYRTKIVAKPSRILHHGIKPTFAKVHALIAAAPQEMQTDLANNFGHEDMTPHARREIAQSYVDGNESMLDAAHVLQRDLYRKDTKTWGDAMHKVGYDAAWIERKAVPPGKPSTADVEHYAHHFAVFHPSAIEHGEKMVESLVEMAVTAAPPAIWGQTQLKTGKEVLADRDSTTLATHDTWPHGGLKLHIIRRPSQGTDWHHWVYTHEAYGKKPVVVGHGSLYPDKGGGLRVSDAFLSRPFRGYGLYQDALKKVAATTSLPVKSSQTRSRKADASWKKMGATQANKGSGDDTWTLRESVIHRITDKLCEMNFEHKVKHGEDEKGNHVYDWHQTAKDGTVHHYRAWFDRTDKTNRYDTGFGIVNPKTGNLDTHAEGHGVDMSDVCATYCKALRHHIEKALPARHGTLRHVEYQYQPVPDKDGKNAGVPHDGRRAQVYRAMWKSRRFGGGTNKFGTETAPHPLLKGATVGYTEEDAKQAVMSVSFPRGLHRHLRDYKKSIT